MPAPRPIEAAARYAAVFLVMMSNLMLELLLTRIFSATMWYHFAFMAVSIALFGTTVGAVGVYMWPHHFATERAWLVAARFALLYAGSIVFCTLLQLQMTPTFGASWGEIGRLAVLYVMVAIPFTLSGVFICLALVRAQDRLGAVYCADLLGAGAGCALFVPFMAYGDGPRAALLLAALGAAGAACMARAARDRRMLGAAAAVAALSLFAFLTHLDGDLLRVRWSKGNVEFDHEFEQWNAFSRLTVDSYPWQRLPFGWGLSARGIAAYTPVEQKLLSIDGGADTPLTAFDGDFGKPAFLHWDVTALAHAIRSRGSVLVIGVGGGRDILTALSFGHPRVVGAEVNHDILRLLRGRFADFTGRLAFRPDVELVPDEGRSYLARSREHFDVIQASMVDTFAAAANGAYVLSENALYTIDAFQVFLDHLTPQGVLSVSRWHPYETLRLLSLASAALRHRGVAEPRQHLFLASSGPQGRVVTLLVSPQPFSPDDVEALERWSTDKGFEELLSPLKAQEAIYEQLAAPEVSDAALRAEGLDLRPPTDDRPFFFNMVSVWDAFGAVTTSLQLYADAVVTLVRLFLVIILLSVVFILAPLWLRRSDATAAPRATIRLIYFAAVGLGFILLELSLMQRLMITLGHPVYGLTVVLFSLLVAAGSGSLWTQRRLGHGATSTWLWRSLVALVVVATAIAAGGSIIAKSLEGAATGWRIAAAVAVLMPLGFVMGMPLSAGLAFSASDPPGYRALYWGVNGAASVCGSVLAIMLSLTYGITATYFTGVLAYGICAGLAGAAFRSHPVATPGTRRVLP
ncbi:MAG: hypothetical protein ACHQ9S_00150 [Candidatus Binatia bacterium]